MLRAFFAGVAENHRRAAFEPIGEQWRGFDVQDFKPSSNPVNWKYLQTLIACRDGLAPRPMDINEKA